MTEKEKKQVDEFKKEVEKDINKKNLHLETIAAFSILAIVVTLIGYGIYWYLGSRNYNEDYSTKLNFNKTTSSSVSNDEMKDWKTYTSTKYNFSIKYPSSFVVSENETSSGSTYVGSNVFSIDNVIFDNQEKKYAISLNMDEIFGRGGTCVKKNITYSTEILANKLILSNKKEIDNSLNSGENLMCDNANLNGYSISTIPKTGSGYQIQNNHNYFFHSESTSTTDLVVAEITNYFEKMMATMEWK